MFEALQYADSVCPDKKFCLKITVPLGMSGLTVKLLTAKGIWESIKFEVREQSTASTILGCITRLKKIKKIPINFCILFI